MGVKCCQPECDKYGGEIGVKNVVNQSVINMRKNWGKNVVNQSVTSWERLGWRDK